MAENDNESLVADKNAHDAIQLIGGLDDVEMLKSISATDTRKTVKDAAEKRLADLEPSDVVLDEGPAVWQVEIPLCLLGRKYVLASSVEEAGEKYKAPCGITRHAQPLQATRTDFDPENLPEGVELYGE